MQATNRTAWSASSRTLSTIFSSRVTRLAVNGMGATRFVYANAYVAGTGEDPFTNTVYVKGAVEYPRGSGNIVPMTFNGKLCCSIAPGGRIPSDPLGLGIPPGGTFNEMNTVACAMPPDISAIASSSGGSLAAGTWYYKVTCVCEGESESNASNEVSVVTTGSSSTVTVLITDKNMLLVPVLRYNIYRGNASGAETFLGSVSGAARQFTDTGVNQSFSTTIAATAANTRQIAVGSTAGWKAGDLIAIAGVTTVTIKLILSATQVVVNAVVSVTKDQVVTIANAPPSYIVSVPANCPIYDTPYFDDGYRQGLDLTHDTNGFSYLNGTNVIYAAVGVLSVYGRTVVVRPGVAACGDSIVNGTGDSRTSKNYRGFVSRALDDQWPCVNVSVGGETAASFAKILKSSIRMALAQGCKYSVCDYGTNDLGGTLANLKANTLAIAQAFVAAGITHTQTTLLPKAASTDGWQTYVNQINPLGGASETVRQAFNQWLRAPASAGAGASFLADLGTATAAFVHIDDTGLAVERNPDGSAITIDPATGAISNGTGGLWLVYGTTQYATKVGTTSGTINTLTDSGQTTWTKNQWQGYMAAVTTAGVTTYTNIVSNTTTGQVTFGSNLNTSPTSTTTYYFFKGPTIDGTHPTDFIHALMALQINTSRFV